MGSCPIEQDQAACRSTFTTSRSHTSLPLDCLFSSRVSSLCTGTEISSAKKKKTTNLTTSEVNKMRKFSTACQSRLVRASESTNLMASWPWRSSAPGTSRSLGKRLSSSCLRISALSSRYTLTYTHEYMKPSPILLSHNWWTGTGWSDGLSQTPSLLRKY